MVCSPNHLHFAIRGRGAHPQGRNGARHERSGGAAQRLDATVGAEPPEPAGQEGCGILSADAWPSRTAHHNMSVIAHVFWAEPHLRLLWSLIRRRGTDFVRGELGASLQRKARSSETMNWMPSTTF